MYNPYNYGMGSISPLLGGVTPSFMPQQQPMLQQQQQQPVNGLVWVKSKESVMQISMPPNSTSQPILDENGTQFYVVTTDGAGSKSIETFDYTPHVDKPVPQLNTSDFVSRAEFESFVNKMLGGNNNGTNGPTQATQSES